MLDPECDFTVGTLLLYFTVFCQVEFEYIKTFLILLNTPMKIGREAILQLELVSYLGFL